MIDDSERPGAARPLDTRGRCMFHYMFTTAAPVRTKSIGLNFPLGRGCDLLDSHADEPS